MSDSKDFENLPATHKLVDETRSELKSDIASLRIEVQAGFKRIESIVEDQNAKVHRIHALFEDMLNQNKMILDTLTVNNDRIDKIEKAIATQ